MKLEVKILFFLVLISSLLLVSCQPQHDIAKLKTQITEMNDVMTKSILESDPDASLKLFADDIISLPSYKPMMKGIEALKESGENQPPMNMKSFTLTTTDVLVSGNFVVEIGTYDLVVGMPAEQGGDFPDKGKYLTLFQVQKDGSLLIKADTWNTDFNPWEMMAQVKAEEKE